MAGRKSGGHWARPVAGAHGKETRMGPKPPSVGKAVSRAEAAKRIGILEAAGVAKQLASELDAEIHAGKPGNLSSRVKYLIEMLAVRQDKSPDRVLTEYRNAARKREMKKTKKWHSVNDLPPELRPALSFIGKRLQEYLHEYPWQSRDGDVQQRTEKIVQETMDADLKRLADLIKTNPGEANELYNTMFRNAFEKGA